MDRRDDVLLQRQVDERRYRTYELRLMNRWTGRAKSSIVIAGLVEVVILLAKWPILPLIVGPAVIAAYGFACLAIANYHTIRQLGTSDRPIVGPKVDMATIERDDHDRNC